MGICISSASSEIHQAEDGLGNVLYLEGKIPSDGAERLGSVYSTEGSKRLNQDAAILDLEYGMDRGAFCGVFDGHGRNGHTVSKMVRNKLPSLLLSQKNAIANIAVGSNNNEMVDENLGPTEYLQQWKEAFVSAFEVMDKEIKLQVNLDCSSSGTTAVVVIKLGEDLFISNLGDSRAVLGMINGDRLVPIQLTRDLKPSVPSEADRIKKCDGRVLALRDEPHVQRVWLPRKDSPGLAMSRAFGDFLLKNHGIIALPDISHHRITSDDQFIFLATDGVWDVLSNDQVSSIVWAAESEQAAAKAVVEAAAAAWRNKFPYFNMDDCTAVCLFLRKRKQHCFSSLLLPKPVTLLPRF